MGERTVSEALVAAKLDQMRAASSRRSRAWGIARRIVAATLGRGRLWSWLWVREFASLVRDRGEVGARYFWCGKVATEDAKWLKDKLLRGRH